MLFKINPLYLMYPPTLLCSYAFMLPVSSGPNAIAFPHAQMSTFKMLRVGLGMNLISLVVVMVAANTYGAAMFDFREFPLWAESGQGSGDNVTEPCAVRASQIIS